MRSVHRPLIVCLVLAAACTLPRQITAQRVGDLSPSRFDAAVYGGISYTTDWLEVDGVGFGFGFQPIIGGAATFWAAPRIGLRAHGAYIPAELPANEDFADFPIPDGRILNVWLADLDLMYRPWAIAPDASDWLSSAYLWLGGGVLISNPAGDGGGQECVQVYLSADACLPYDAKTVAQGTIGLGLDLIPLTRNLSIYTELGLHVYDSPFEVGDSPGFVDLSCPGECEGSDQLVLTPRLVGGLKLKLGQRRPPVAVFIPPPPPPPPVAPLEEQVQLCVVVDGLPRYVRASYRPDSGDTVVVTEQGISRPFAAVYPGTPTVASDRTWYINNEPVFMNGRKYQKVSLPRTLAAEQLSRSGSYEGVPVFTLRGEAASDDFYLPVVDGCQFQRYQREEEIRRVRG